MPLFPLPFKAFCSNLKSIIIHCNSFWYSAGGKKISTVFRWSVGSMNNVLNLSWAVLIWSICLSSGIVLSEPCRGPVSQSMEPGIGTGLSSALHLLLGKRSTQGLCLCIPRKEWLMGLKAEPLCCLEMELWLKLNLSFCSVTDGQVTVTNFLAIINCTESSKPCTLLRYGCPICTVHESWLDPENPYPVQGSFTQQSCWF